MNYRQWLDGGCGCNVNINCCGDINPCDCDEILLEISNLHTDDAVLQEEIDDLSGEVETKLDASAYTPVDLSDYYTKEQSDERFLTEHQKLKTINGESLVGEGNIVISGGSGTSVTVDDHLDNTSTNPVQNKVIVGALNGKLDASAYTPTDISNYTLKSELIQYITNLQEQINSLASSISGCCGQTGETQYRWITMTGENDYWCSGTTKYSKEKKQSSTDGITWTDVIPEETRNGSTILEVNCIDCGYQPVTSENADVAIVFSTNDQAPYQLATNASNVTTTHICVYTGTGSYSSVCKDYASGFTQITDAVLKDVHPYSTAFGFGAEVFKNTSVISNNEFSGNAANSVTLVSGITEIGDYAFANSTAELIGRPQMTPSYLNEWWLDLASIGNYAFANNPNLTTVYLYGLNNVPTLGTGAFDNCPRLAHIYVDADKVNSFKTSSGWSNYASIIQAA